MFHSIDILHTSLNATTDRVVVELDGVVIPYQNSGTPPNNESQFTSAGNFFLNILSRPFTPPANELSDVQFNASSPNSIGSRFVVLSPYPNLTVVGDCYTVTLTQTNVNFPNLNIILRLFTYANYPAGSSAALWDFATDGPICHFTQVQGGFSGQNALSAGACCVAKGSLVATVDGYRPIEQLRAGQQLIDVDGNSIELLQLVKFNHPVPKSICIPPGSLNVNSPSQVLHICSGHPILLNGKEVDPESLIGSNGISYQNQPIFVYTLLTEHRSFVDIQNCQVCTWSHDAWLNFAENGSKRVGSWEFSG